MRRTVSVAQGSIRIYARVEKVFGYLIRRTFSSGAWHLWSKNEGL